MPTYHLITFGCQMNKNDSERIESLLQSIGFVATPLKEEADLILVNTCSVRQSAEDRVFGLMRQFRALKEARPNLMIGVTGCMAGRDRDGALRKKLHDTVDFFFPISDLPQLPRWIAEVRPDLVKATEINNDYLKIAPLAKNAHSAFVTIQTGCNKFCTYCVVPFARGLEKNRSVREILDEVRSRAEQGAVEITLLGQTVNSHRAPDLEHFSRGNPFIRRGSFAHAQDDRRGGDHFAALLWEVNQVPGISRLHFTAPHPLHMTDEVIEAMTLPAHVNFIHLPVQAGDDEVLRRMNRRYTSAQFLETVDRIKVRIPNIAIGTDIIVGFCGESEAAFQKTVDLYERVRFDISYTARYSVRSGTAAARAFQDDVSKEEKKRRWDVLQEVQERIVFEKNQAYVGKVVSVLVDRCEPSKLGPAFLGTCFGNSREMKLVSFPGGPELIGKVILVRIEKVQMWILTGARV